MTSHVSDAVIIGGYPLQNYQWNNYIGKNKYGKTENKLCDKIIGNRGHERKITRSFLPLRLSQYSIDSAKGNLR